MLQEVVRPCRKSTCQWKENTRIVSCKSKWETFWQDFSLESFKVEPMQLRSWIRNAWQEEEQVSSTMIFSCAIRTTIELLQLAVRCPSLSPTILAGLLDRVMWKPTTSISLTDALLSNVVEFLLNMRFKLDTATVRAIETAVMDSIEQYVMQSDAPVMTICANIMSVLPLDTIVQLIQRLISHSRTKPPHEAPLTHQLLESWPHWFFAMGCVAHSVLPSTGFFEVLDKSDVSQAGRAFIRFYIIVHHWKRSPITHEVVQDSLQLMPSALVAAYLHVCQGYSSTHVRSHVKQQLVMEDRWDIVPFATLSPYPLVRELIGIVPVLTLMMSYETIVRSIQVHVVKQPVIVVRRKRRHRVFEMSDVLRHIFQFVTAKRLCRLAVVSRPFHEASQSPWLWKTLYITKWTDRCSHGTLYRHEWKNMYRDRLPVARKMQSGRRHCYHCGCASYFTSPMAHVRHLKNHCVNQCTIPDCGSNFGSLAALKRHKRSCH